MPRQHPEKGVCYGTFSLTKANHYLDFIGNDDSVKDKYLGGMSNYNIRQYSYGD